MTGYELVLKVLNYLKELEELDPSPLEEGRTRQEILGEARVEYELKKMVLEACIKGLNYGDLSKEGKEKCKIGE